jgi:hypothetical protein
MGARSIGVAIGVFALLSVAHGGMDYVPYLLSQLRQYEVTSLPSSPMPRWPTSHSHRRTCSR